MRIHVSFDAQNPDRRSFDVAERKGHGHPDTLADEVANRFSMLYCANCLESIGEVPNHWVDKVTLVGASSTVSFGEFWIQKPIDCYLFGKITDQVGTQTIDVPGLFRRACREVFHEELGRDDISAHTRFYVNNTRGISTDHTREFYLPQSRSDLRAVIAADSVANDTAACTAASQPSGVAQLAWRLEDWIFRQGRQAIPGIGTDVKAMTVRVGNEIDITLAIPVYPEAVSSQLEYKELLRCVMLAITPYAEELVGLLGAGFWQLQTLRINTKDSDMSSYLAPFGTSLGKGDCGAVGRGNRYNGVIEPLRLSSAEAPAGKNPRNHAGKLYTWLAHLISKAISDELDAYAEVTIVSRNGTSLSSPPFVFVALDKPEGAPAITRKVEELCLARMGSLQDLTTEFIRGCSPGLIGSPLIHVKTQ